MKAIKNLIYMATCWLLLLAAVPAMAQKQQEKAAARETKKHTASTVNVRGSVMESERFEPLAGASVRLFSADSVMVCGNSTGADGQFLLPGVPQGRYVMKVTFVGFRPQQFSLDLTKKKGNHKTPDILLRENATVMAEAVVEGQMPEMVVVEDTVAYNADAFKLPEGAMVEELLKKLPGVEVDENGKMTWNGKSISRILVDGKRFFAGNQDMLLKNIPADMIEKIKAYDKQSDLERFTGIDDGEEQIVFDLTVKKEKKRGNFGQAEAGYGTRDRYQGRLNANRFMDEQKFTVVADAGNTRGDGMSDHQEGAATMNWENEKLELNGSMHGKFSQGESERATSTQSFVRKSYGNSLSTSETRGQDIGLDYKVEWQPDTLTELELKPTFTYTRNRGENQGRNATFNDDPYQTEGITDPLNQLDLLSSTIGVNSRLNAGRSRGDNLSGGASLSLRRKLGKQGRTVSVGMGGNLTDGTGNSSSYNQVDYYRILAVTGEDSIYHKAQYNASDNRQQQWNARASYTEPVGRQMYLQASYSFSHRLTRHTRDVRSITDPLCGQLGVGMDNYADMAHLSSPDIDQCNATENTYANHNIDLQWRIVRTRYRITAGVSAKPQYNAVDYAKGAKDYHVSRHVVNASPTLNFRYRFSKQEQLRLQYGGNTGQPNITDLIPDTLSNANPLNIRLGNPDLKPSFTQQMKADYNKSIPSLQRSFTASAQFRTTQNSTTSRTEYDEETGGRVTKPENVNGNWNGRMDVNFNTALKGDTRFRINTNTQASLTNAIGYAYDSQEKTSMRRRTRGMNLREHLRLTFHTDWLEVNAHGAIRYNHSRSNSSDASNLDTYTFNYGMSTVMNLPWGMTFGTDVGAYSRRGYSDASMNTNQVLWSLSVSQRFLRKNNLILSLRATDILNQRDNINRSVTETGRTDSRSELVHSYVLCSLTYKFGKFGGKQKKGKESGRPAHHSFSEEDF